jgi:hypothetical protein
MPCRVNHTTTNAIRNDLKEIKELVSSHETRISSSEVKIQNVESSLEKLEREHEDMRKEMGKINLIIQGIPDTVDETEDELYSRVKIFLLKQVEDDVSFDSAYRLGKPKPHYRRPIRIRFMTLLQRNLVYESRNKALPPFYINEDLPFATRRDFSVLRKKKRETIQSGIPAEEVKIDYKNKTITIQSTQHHVKNGILQSINSSIIIKTPF